MNPGLASTRSQPRRHRRDSRRASMPASRRRGCRRRGRCRRRCSRRRAETRFRRKLPLEDVERVPADLLPALDERLVALGAAGEEPEAARADVRLEQVLLEEEPLRGARPAELVGRQERRSLGEVEKDRTRLREVLPDSSSSTGVRPAGFRAMCSGVCDSPAKMSTGTRSSSSPSWAARSRTL